MGRLLGLSSDMRDRLMYALMRMESQANNCFYGVRSLNLAFCGGGLKLLRKTGLFENAVGGVTRPDFPIYGKSEFRKGAVPDFVISFALPFKMAAIFGKDLLDDRGVISHFGIGF